MVIVEKRHLNTHELKVTTVDAYKAGFPPEIQDIIEQTRKTILEAAPGATETISYQIPAYTLCGMLVYFGAFKKHLGFYPRITGIDSFKDELSQFKGAKGSVQFPYNQPIPYDLIARITKFRVEENLQIAAAKNVSSV